MRLEFSLFRIRRHPASRARTSARSVKIEFGLLHIAKRAMRQRPVEQGDMPIDRHVFERLVVCAERFGVACEFKQDVCPVDLRLGQIRRQYERCVEVIERFFGQAHCAEDEPSVVVCCGQRPRINASSVNQDVAG